MNWRIFLIVGMVITLASVPQGTKAYQIAPNPNHGSIYIDSADDAENNEFFRNYSLIRNDGNLLNNNRLQNYSESNLENYGFLKNDKYLFNHGSIENQGTMTNNSYLRNVDGTLSNNNKLYNNYWLINHLNGIINNSNSIINNSLISNYGNLNNNGIVSNKSTLLNKPDSILNNYEKFNNDNFELKSNKSINFGTLNNYGTFTNNANRAEYQRFTNASKFNNYNDFINNGYFFNNKSGIFSNFEKFTNMGNFLNVGILENNSTLINNSGSIINMGEFNGTGNYIGKGAIQNDGIIDQTLIDIQGGILSGSGTIIGQVNVDSKGAVYPGTPGGYPGELTINGNLLSSGRLILRFDLEKGDFSALNIDGNAVFSGGRINFYFDRGYPSIGDYWDFLFADSITGWESLAINVRARDELGWEIESTSTGKRLIITAVPVPATFFLFITGIGFFSCHRRRKLSAQG